MQNLGRFFDSSDGENVVAFISRISEGAKILGKEPEEKSIKEIFQT